MKIYPKNKAFFKKLIPFTQKIIKLCQENKIQPVIYGSFAHFFYTKDKNMKVNDIDMLFTRKDLKKLNKILKEKKIKFIRCSPKDCSMIVKKGKLKVELDEAGTNHIINEKSLSKNIFNTIDFYGIKVKMITLKQLEKMYPIARNEAVKTKPKVIQRIQHLENFLGRKLK